MQSVGCSSSVTSENNSRERVVRKLPLWLLALGDEANRDMPVGILEVGVAVPLGTLIE